MSSHAVLPAEISAPVSSRQIVYRTRGRQHGPIVRLVSPSDVGELIKPFVFLDQIDVDISSAPQFGFHPHSGIATLTLLIEGGFAYEDSTGAKGTMEQGGVEWMQAGGGVWHTGNGIGQRMKGYQLWVALPPALESKPATSQYVGHENFHRAGPARVILGDFEGIHSPIHAPSAMNYLDVSLEAGEVWRYQPPKGHDVAWIAVYDGSVTAPEAVASGELVVFDRSEEAITFRAQGKSSFVLGSAVKHPHDLVLGYYSVHTSADALEKGEANIQSIGKELRLSKN